MDTAALLLRGSNIVNICLATHRSSRAQHQHRTDLLPPSDKNVRQPMRFLILRRITTAVSGSLRFDRSKILPLAVDISGNNCCNLGDADTMAEKAEKKDDSRSNNAGESTTTTALNGEKEGDDLNELEKSTPRDTPPPPEKPSPDDCCGSGCVRCVWDVYYDALEEYNKLYKKS